MKIKNNVYAKTYRILLDLANSVSVNAAPHYKEEIETIVAVYAEENEERIFDVDKSNNNDS